MEKENTLHGHLTPILKIYCTARVLLQQHPYNFGIFSENFMPNMDEMTQQRINASVEKDRIYNVVCLQKYEVLLC